MQQPPLQSSAGQSPKVCQSLLRCLTYAIAVLPVPGCPPIRIALPAILPSRIILRITPAARLASTCKQRTKCQEKNGNASTILGVWGRTYLSDHTLGDFPWVKRIVETKTSDMGVSSNTLDSGEVLDFLDLGVDSRC